MKKCSVCGMEELFLAHDAGGKKEELKPVPKIWFYTFEYRMSGKWFHIYIPDCETRNWGFWIWSPFSKKTWIFEFRHPFPGCITENICEPLWKIRNRKKNLRVV